MSKQKSKNKRKKAVQKASRIPTTEKTTTEKQWPPSKNQKDDLQLIQGIGLATEMALNKIGILKFNDFQNYTLETLARALEADAGVSILALDIKKQDWIGHANRLAEKHAVEDFTENLSESIETESQPNDVHKSSSEKTKPDKDKKSNGEVDLQTANQPKLETDQNVQTHLDEQNQIKQQKHSQDSKKSKASSSESQKIAKPEKPKKPANAKAELQKEEKSESKINIKKIRFKQVSTNGVKGKKILKSDVTFALDGKKSGALLNEKTPFCVQIHALEESTDHTQILASDTTSLKADKLDYDVRLNCRIPKVGNYQLKIVVFSLNPASMIDFREGPALRIVP